MMMTAKQRSISSRVPKNRKERIIYLINEKRIDINVLAKALEKRKDNLLRTIHSKAEINSLRIIMQVYYCMNGEVSLSWLITGRPPYKAPDKLFTYKRIPINIRIKQVLEEEGLSITSYSDLIGKPRSAAIDSLSKLNIKINHVLIIHLSTGVALDYLLDGNGPRYIWDKDMDLMDLMIKD